MTRRKAAPDAVAALRARAARVRLATKYTTKLTLTLTVARFEKLVALAEHYNRPVSQVAAIAIDYGITRYEFLRGQDTPRATDLDPSLTRTEDAPTDYGDAVGRYRSDPTDYSEQRQAFAGLLPRSSPRTVYPRRQENVFHADTADQTADSGGPSLFGGGEDAGGD
jgi:hypothetical protein